MGFYGLVALFHYITFPNALHMLAKAVSASCSALAFSLITSAVFFATLTSHFICARRVGRLLQDQDEATLVSSCCGPLFIRFCLHLCIRLRLFFGTLHCFDNQFIQYRHIHII
jgi:threonine/homoserine/homoserine lactone efflux protein